MRCSTVHAAGHALHDYVPLLVRRHLPEVLFQLYLHRPQSPEAWVAGQQHLAPRRPASQIKQG